MTSLPKRGDRVRVTEVRDNTSGVAVGEELTLPTDCWSAYGDWLSFGFGCVKVEILERAGAAIVDDETWINAGCPSQETDLDALDAWLCRVIAMSDEYAKDLARKLSAELRQARARVRELEQAHESHQRLVEEQK